MEYKLPTPVLVSKNLINTSKVCWKQQALRVSKVQEITKGKGAVLALLDDGVGSNDELSGLDITRWSYFDSSQDHGSHSTFAVTVIAGKKLGIFPEMTIISKQVLDPATSLGGSKQVVSAIYKAADMGIQTINLSLGSNFPDPAIEKALKYYCSNGINIATIAAGNDGPGKGTSDYPANYAAKIQGVLSNAATQIDEFGNISVALFSSRGKVSIGAPGHLLKSMDHKGRLDLISGTSFSAPITGAAIAVARTMINRPLYQTEILDMLSQTSCKIDTYDAIGEGTINIYDFLMMTKELPKERPTVINPNTNFCDKIRGILGL
jgi:Subtilase family